jgi:hypothetical protein
MHYDIAAATIVAELNFLAQVSGSKRLRHARRPKLTSAEEACHTWSVRGFRAIIRITHVV